MTHSVSNDLNCMFWSYRFSFSVSLQMTLKKFGVIGQTLEIYSQTGNVQHLPGKSEHPFKFSMIAERKHLNVSIWSSL